MTQGQIKAITDFGNELTAKLEQMAEANPYDRIGILQAQIAVQCLLIGYQTRGILSTMRGDVVSEAEQIVREE